MPFATDQPAALPSGPIVQLPAPEAKLSLKSCTPTFVVTLTVDGPLFASGEETVTLSVYLPALSPFVFGASDMVEGAAPLAGFRTSHGDVAVAVQFNVPDPVFVTLIGCGVGLAEVAPKNVRDDGVTDRIAALTANVTGIVTGAFSAPGAYTVKVPLYAPCANPFGFAVTVIVAGVTIEETEAVSELALLVTVHAVD